MEHIVDMTGVVTSVSGIETFPEGAVREPVVRCGGCDHTTIETHTGDSRLTCWVFKVFGIVVKPDHHCGYGVPKTGCQNAVKNGKRGDGMGNGKLSGCEAELIILDELHDR